MGKRVVGQLSLDLRTADADAWMACRGLFSLNYLNRHVLKADFMPPLDVAKRLHGKVKAL